MTTTVTLTKREAEILRLCLQGEIENDSPYNGDYFAVLRRVARKLDKAAAK